MGSFGTAAAADALLEDVKSSGSPRVYYPWFDWLRFGLALVVLVYHEGLLQQPRAGHFAVQVFFALSGWLIGGVLIHLPRKELTRFYFNRALRIWSPYFLAVLFLIAASLQQDRLTHKWVEIFFYDVTFVYNIFGTRQLWNQAAAMPLHATGNHFWSVNAEEQFYLLAPLLLVVAPRRIGRNIGLWIALAFAAWISNTYASIAFGVVAALLADSLGPFQEIAWFRAGAGLCAALSGLAMVLGANYDLLSPVCAIAIVLLFAIKGKRHPLGEIAGGLSYPLYLNQWTAWFVLKLVLHGRQLPFSGAFITIPTSLVFAAMLYWRFDRVILARRKHLYSPRRGRSVMVLAYAGVTIGFLGGMLMVWRHG